MVLLLVITPSNIESIPEWTLIASSGSAADRPSVRSEAKVICYGKKMILFGGWGDTWSNVNDLWELDLETYAWALRINSGTSSDTLPITRKAHSLANYNDTMFYWELAKDYLTD